MNLKTFFQIPLVKFCVHLVIVAGFFVNMTHFYRVWEMERQIAKELRTLEILQQENADSRNQRDYFTSDLYREKYAKEENYKKRGEEVIDTSVLEPSTASQEANFLPVGQAKPLSNPEKWWLFFFGGDPS